MIAPVEDESAVPHEDVPEPRSEPKGWFTRLLQRRAA